MMISKSMKEDVAFKAARKLLDKRRDEAYLVLQEKLTDIADRQFSSVPIAELHKYESYVRFENHLDAGIRFPNSFRFDDRLFRRLGFRLCWDIPLLKEYPVDKGSYRITVSDALQEEYTNAVREYYSLYFNAVKNYELISESLASITTTKQLEENFPELSSFWTVSSKSANALVPIETLTKCKILLQSIPANTKEDAAS